MALVPQRARPLAVFPTGARLLVLAGGVVFAVASCSPATPAVCDVTSCPAGCCDASGACQPGTADEACGTGAAACAACATGTTCAGQACVMPTVGGGSGGGSMGGGAGGGGDDDAGMDVDAGADDAGLEDAGTEDAGTADASTADAGCGPAVRLAVVSPAQTFVTRVCSAPVRVQLQDACGQPVVAAADVPLGLTPSTLSMQLFTDPSCISMRLSWSIAAGQSEVTLHVKDTAPGMPTLTASSTGLASAVHTFTLTCPTAQKPCGTLCIPTAGCCTDGDCTDGGVQLECNMLNACVMPSCAGTIPAGCGVYDDRTAPAASRTVTFGSSGYSPKCMRVTNLQDVTFSGNFFLHPLVQTCGPADVNLTTTSGTTRTVRFSSFGTYGYRCANHPQFEQGSIRTP